MDVDSFSHGFIKRFLPSSAWDFTGLRSWFRIETYFFQGPTSLKQRIDKGSQAEFYATRLQLKSGITQERTCASSGFFGNIDSHTRYEKVLYLFFEMDALWNECFRWCRLLRLFGAFCRSLLNSHGLSLHRCNEVSEASQISAETQ